jgi:hypothetical protein
MSLVNYGANVGFMVRSFRLNNPKGVYSVEIVVGPTLEEQDF